MNEEIEKVIEELGKELLILVQTVLKEQGISPQSNLYKDAEVQVDASQNGIVIDLFLSNYITYIENGRAPQTGKRPPIEALKDWALNKGLPTDNGTLHAISYAIWRDGLAPRPILATLEQRIEEYMNNELTDKLIESFTTELNKYFK